MGVVGAIALAALLSPGATVPLLVRAAGAMIVAFLAGSPYVALDFPTFRKDFLFEMNHLSEGHYVQIGRSRVMAFDEVGIIAVHHPHNFGQFLRRHWMQRTPEALGSPHNLPAQRRQRTVSIRRQKRLHFGGMVIQCGHGREWMELPILLPISNSR